MASSRTDRRRIGLIWGAAGLIALVPVLAAMGSPLLAWRQPVYIAAGFAGILALALLLFQPLLARGGLPGTEGRRGRRLHAALGLLLVGAIVVHVAGLWITSPPDVIDALLLASPTPFSLWGVLAMWGLFALAASTLIRRRGRIWRRLHRGLALCVVAGSVVHALLIQGTMEPVTKLLLCACVGVAACAAVFRARGSGGLLRKR
ncbi:ferric reductase-like transmembrane domain-containing protein [Maritimibacter alkaliphilus]|uniref:ferric reductase-like transmembrane domain-containing protein n=1 Tax=Maritimibacter alkaliphilus TaxID=404236 RepID=UPI0021BD530C|nr:ferric reductase-like transmembrane domain-containing protein [Maritimibacter alkaliphilus]